MASHMAMHRAGVAVGLGCDAPNANDGVDILDAARLAVGIAKDAAIDPTCASAYDGLEMATIGGAAAAGMADRIGSLEVGKAADLVVHDATGAAVAAAGQPGPAADLGGPGPHGPRRPGRRARRRPRRALHHRRRGRPARARAADAPGRVLAARRR